VFTGIIETTGSVRNIEPRSDLTRFEIEAIAIASEVAIGDSVAVNGTCLTVTSTESAVIHFDAVVETLEKTALGDLVEGSRVNLERALVAGGRLDGHIVQGHVDGVGRVRVLERAGNDVRLAIDCPEEFRQYLLAKAASRSTVPRNFASTCSRRVRLQSTESRSRSSMSTTQVSMSR